MYVHFVCPCVLFILIISGWWESYTNSILPEEGGFTFHAKIHIWGKIFVFMLIVTFFTVTFSCHLLGIFLLFISSLFTVTNNMVLLAIYKTNLINWASQVFRQAHFLVTILDWIQLNCTQMFSITLWPKTTKFHHSVLHLNRIMPFFGHRKSG